MYSTNKQNKAQGWFSIYRSLIHSDMWLSEKFTRGQAWVDLVGLANHKRGGFRVRGIWVTVERGQLGWSIREIADRWHWSPTKVKLFLLELKNDAQIRTQFSNLTTIITIINYDEYQNNEPQNGTQKEHRQDTEEDQTDINNNINNDNNENNTASDLAELNLPLINMPELAILKKVPGYPFDVNKDFTKLSQLAEEFPMVDIVPMLKNWVEYIGDNKFTAKSSPRAQLRNQFKTASEKGFYKKQGGNGKQPGAGGYDYKKYAEEQAKEGDK